MPVSLSAVMYLPGLPAPVVTTGTRSSSTSCDDVVDVRGQQHEVDAEGLVGERLRAADLLAQDVGRHLPGADDAEPARVADGGDELGRRRPGHAALDDGVLDAEQLGQPGVQRHASKPPCPGRQRPANDRGAPREPGAEADERDQVAGRKSPASIQVVQRQRYRGRRRVAGLRDVAVRRGRRRCPRRSSIVSRMRWFAWCGTSHARSSTRVAALVERLRRGLRDDAHGELEDLVAVHLDVLLARGDAPRRCRAAAEPPAGILSRSPPAPSAPRTIDSDTGLVGRLQARPRRRRRRRARRCARSVKSMKPRERVRADHEHGVRASRLDRSSTGVERVDEAGARRLDVERRAGQPELGLDDARGRREQMVRTRRPDDEQVDLVGDARAHASALHAPPRRRGPRWPRSRRRDGARGCRSA